ncbi:hypothetical protein SEA_VINCENZO_50 [Mycobacterium phage Vincenzo]|uniref:Uncharacterized protein n=2 Tax=Coopervirus vincenzo TaxID=1983110 RepID=A0A0F6SJJ2_9CAUD|nr:hypothetical protein SEA_VINCENZO_50 [Mycobacterium phage Vincenzo]AKF14312.1 hypothetical protein SEA_VINCENZO_50 [Mycobacterium phage Vincenzo]AKF14716.1 hypothetical protein SEA_ALANGRANT_51 [Mycobacterium phage AlanGrant]
MIVIRARVVTSVDIDPHFATDIEEAQQRITDKVRDMLAQLGNVREGVTVTLELDDVPQMRDVDVFTDAEDDYRS